MPVPAARSRLRQLLVHGGLFVATFVCMTAAFSTTPGDPFSRDGLIEGLYFSVPALMILASHEFGHYFMARAWGVETSLPYFLPMPLPLGFGTLGAVIRLKGRIPSRNALFDIGAGGPLAGLAIALPLLVVGTFLSHPVPSPVAAPFPPNESLLHFGVWLGQWVRHALDGVEQPAPEMAQMMFFGDNLLTLLLTRQAWGSWLRAPTSVRTTCSSPLKHFQRQQQREKTLVNHCSLPRRTGM